MCEILMGLLAPLISFGFIPLPLAICEPEPPVPAETYAEAENEPEVVAQETLDSPAHDTERSGVREAHVLTGDALAVADCESGDWRADGTAVTGSWSAEGQNPVSSASGAFQFIDSTWEWVTGLPAPASSHSMDVQLEAFEKLWDDRAGMSHWEPSRSCWAGALH